LPRQVIIATGDDRLQSDDRLLVFGSDKKIDVLSHET